MKRTPMPPRAVPLRRQAMNRAVATQPPPAPGETRSRKRSDRRTVRVDPLWAPARTVALIRDGYRCAVCARPAGEVNHRVPRRMGGRLNDPERHRPDRLVSLCRDHHHIAETVDRAWGIRTGLFVPGNVPATEWPVLYRDGWHLLTPDARRVPVNPNRASELMN